MTPKKRKRMKICLTILALAIAAMLVSSVVHVIHDGWGAFSVVNIVPSCCAAIAMIVILESDKKKSGEE